MPKTTKWWIREPKGAKVDVKGPDPETQKTEPADTPKPKKKGDAMPADTEKVSE